MNKKRLLTLMGGCKTRVLYNPYNLAASTKLLVQTHVHTTESDGGLSIADVVANYTNAGYDALAITDHDKITVQTGDLIKLVSNEYSPTSGHIVGLGVTDYLRGATTTTQTIIDGIVEDGGLAVLAHPAWTDGTISGYSNEVAAALLNYCGIEIFNAVTMVISDYLGFAVSKWDYLLTNKAKNIWGFASDDFHTITSVRAYNTGRLFVFSDANAAAVLQAIASGAFIADVSNYGVTLNKPVVSKTNVSLNCPSATSIRWIGDNGALLQTDVGESGIYTLKSNSETYVRAEVVGDYTEPFDSAIDVVNRWAVEAGAWAVDSGVLKQTTNSAAAHLLFLKRPVEGDFTAQYDCFVNSGGTGSQQTGLLFNVKGTTNYYYLGIKPTSTDSGVTLYKFVNNTGTLLDSDGTFSENTWYTVKLVYTAAGSIKVKVWVQGGAEPETYNIDLTDTSFCAGGIFGFRCRYLCSIDNLYINGFKSYYQPISVK